MTKTLWRSTDKTRCFLLDSESEPIPGTFSVQNQLGALMTVNDAWLAAFEVTEEEAREWAKRELSEALGVIRGGIDDKLAAWRMRLDEFNNTPVDDTGITPNASPVLMDLLKSLPGVLGDSLSRDENRLRQAKQTMTDMQQRLKETGIDLNNRFTAFPERLADLLKDESLGPDQGKPPSGTGDN